MGRERPGRKQAEQEARTSAVSASRQISSTALWCYLMNITAEGEAPEAQQDGCAASLP